MIIEADLFHYMSNETKKVADQLGEAKLLRVNIDFFQNVEKIDKAYVDYDELLNDLVRVTLIIDDDKKAIGVFDYKIKK